MLAYIVSTLSPELIKIGPISIKWYGFLYALTFVIGYTIMQYFYKREGRNSADVDKLAVFIMVGTILGARLGHCLFYEPSYYLSHPVEILMVWRGGLASHGGAIGILLSLWLYVRKNRDYSFLWVVDRLVVIVPLGGVFIRTGNLFNSEIVGKPTDVPWAVIFTRHDMLPRHPSQVYEALVYLVIFIILMLVYRQNNIKNNVKTRQGLLFGLFLVLVFSARFFLEFFKEYQSAFEQNWPLYMGQLLSIPFVLVGVYFIYYALVKTKK